MTNNSNNKILTNKVINNEKQKTLEDMQKKTNYSDCINSINVINFNLTELSKTLTKIQQSAFPYNLKQDNEFFSKSSQVDQIISKMNKYVIPKVTESSEKLSESLKNIINSCDFSNLIKITVTIKLQNIISQFYNSIESLNNERLSGYETEFLKKCFG